MGSRPLTPLVLLLSFAVACAPPNQGAAGAPEILFVASGATGIISRIDASNGRPVGPPLPAGSAAWSLVPAPNGGVLALPLSWSRPGTLTHVRPTLGRNNAWEQRHLQVNAASLAETVVAGAGGRYAVVAAAPTPTRATGSGSCRLVVLDLIAGTTAREHALCAPRETAHSLALHQSAPDLAHAVAYAGIWHAATSAEPGMVGSGAVHAVRLDTGAALRRLDLQGLPIHLVVAPHPDRSGLRLYCVERWPGPEEWNPGQPGAPAPAWRLLAIDPVSLEIEDTWMLAGEPRSLVVAPDGDAAYVLADGPTSRRSAVVEIDLATGYSRGVAVLPGESHSGLVATRERVFAPHTAGSEVWAIDRRQRRIVQIIPVVPRPTAAVIGG